MFTAETLFAQPKAILHARLDQTINLKSMAAELHVSYAWLRRHLRYHTGLPLHDYHLQLRINRAMQLLSGTTATVKEVAAQTGFEEPQYFSRLFKKKTSCSPKEWRDRYLARR